VTDVLPGGTLTFLFADVEGSTRLLESLGRTRYAELLGATGNLLREKFDERGGRQIDTQGDAWFFVFRSALEALLGSADVQRALAADKDEPAVRIGIHTGEAEVANDRYFGLAVHRAARISACAHGGQTIVSATTRDVAEEGLPAGLELRHLGEHRLKDLDRPERLFQLDVDGLPAKFPPLRVHNPPSAGVEQQLAQAVEALRVADADRESAVAALREHTVTGRLTLEEFSERVDEAFGARTAGELERVARELPAPEQPARKGRAARLTVSVFAHVIRRGALRLRRFAFAMSVLGDVDLDLRGVRLETPTSTLAVFALLGNVDVYVPEGVDVDVSGLSIGGHWRDMGRIREVAGGPQLRVRIFTLLGSADIWRLPPGAKGTYSELIKQVKAEQKALPPPA
jgi:class 3 adenylate cyclase